MRNLIGCGVREAEPEPTLAALSGPSVVSRVFPRSDWRNRKVPESDWSWRMAAIIRLAKKCGGVASLTLAEFIELSEGFSSEKKIVWNLSKF